MCKCACTLSAAKRPDAVMASSCNGPLDVKTGETHPVQASCSLACPIHVGANQFLPFRTCMSAYLQSSAKEHSGDMTRTLFQQLQRLCFYLKYNIQGAPLPASTVQRPRRLNCLTGIEAPEAQAVHQPSRDGLPGTGYEARRIRLHRQTSGSIPHGTEAQTKH